MEVVPYVWLKQNLNEKGEDILFNIIKMADPTHLWKEKM